MHPNLTSLNGVTDLDQLLAASKMKPVLLFKHSYTCGISAEALDALVEHLDAEQLDVTYAMVTVQTHRDVSNVITTRLGVRHETPQAILIRNGQAVWTASHFRVTASGVANAIKQAVVAQ